MKITLCGSTRFEDEYHRWNELLTMEGHVVYSLAVFPSTKETREWYIESQKTILDLVHFAKIEVSDTIVVINCAADGWNKEPYIGPSTAKEIQWALSRGKPVFYTKSCRGDVQQLLNNLKVYQWRGFIQPENVQMD